METTRPETTTPLSFKLRAQQYYNRYEHRLAAAFFILGFLFDIVTADRIDSMVTIGQQIFYLTAITLALMQLFFESPSASSHRERRWYGGWFQYRTAIIHFCFGSLLNMYAIFFFKSSSLLVSFIFIGVILGLIVANEFAQFKSLGLPFKFALLALCYLCLFAILVPIAVGAVSILVFLLSMAVGCLPLAAIIWWIQTYKSQYFELAKSQILIPLGSVLFGFLLLYMLRLIPPVPLSLEFIGIYHKIEKQGDEFLLYNQNPWWRFWKSGDQEFIAQKDDKIFVAFRLFSPARFADTVNLRWFWRDVRLGWVEQDTIPIQIFGGREEGFRGYGVKANYQPGEWRVQVETKDRREIGRVKFYVESAPIQPEREWSIDRM